MWSHNNIWARWIVELTDHPSLNSETSPNQEVDQEMSETLCLSDPLSEYKGVSIGDEVYIRDIEPYKGRTQKGLVLSKKRLNFTIVLECGETVTRTEKNIFVAKQGTKLKNNPMYWENLERKWMEGFGLLPWGIAVQRPPANRKQGSCKDHFQRKQRSYIDHFQRNKITKQPPAVGGQSTTSAASAASATTSTVPPASRNPCIRNTCIRDRRQRDFWHDATWHTDLWGLE